MKWVIIILGQLVFAAVAGGCGLLVVVIIEQIFESIAKHPQIKGEMSKSQLKTEIDIIEEPELRYELQRLLAERRMGQWWKFLVWLIVSSIVYALLLFH